MDIDAYACCIAMQELLKLKGKNAIAYSKAPCNYSICKSLLREDQFFNVLPDDGATQQYKYIIVDVSDPEYLKDAVPLENVTEIYDHHVGFEDFWTSRLRDKAKIEFIGAAATLIYREWQKEGLQDQMTRDTALLLIAAILDNTLNLTSSNTTQEDKEVFHALCKKENVGEDWCASYFSEVQQSIEADLKNALLGDVKLLSGDQILPERMVQICIWDAEKIFLRLPQIRQWFYDVFDSWMMNVIDVKHRCSYFVCDDKHYQENIEMIFGVQFSQNIAKSAIAYLRKEIIKKVYENKEKINVGG